MSAVNVTPKSSAGAPSEASYALPDEEVRPFRLPDPNPAFGIDVCNPAVQNANSMRAFVTYEVKAQVSHTDYADNTYEVIRRYSDFEWLYNRLVAEFPHLNIPPLPVKASMGNLEMKFINLRMQMLAKFMIRLTHHEEILDSQGLKIFLTEAMGSEFDYAKKKLPAPREFAAEEKKVGFFAKMKNKVTTSVPKDELVPKCQEYLTYTQNRGQKLNKLVPAAEKYVSRSADLCKASGDMGLAMQEFGKAMESLGSGTDEDHGPLCEAYEQLGVTLGAISELNTEAMCAEEALLVSNVMENVNLLKGVDRIFDERKKALKTFYGIKDGKLTGIDEEEANKNVQMFEDSAQPSLEAANASVDQDVQSMLFSLAQLRKTALIKELQKWEELEQKLDSM